MNKTKNYFSSLLFLASIMLGITSFAATGSEKKGDQLYQLFDFVGAIKLYQSALEKEPANLSVLQKIATCHRMMNNTIEMENWYGQIVKIDSAAPINKFYYAQALRSNEKYDDALRYYNEYKISSKDSRPLSIINGYKYIQKLQKGNPSVKVENLINANSAEMDFSPMFYRDSAIVFVSNAKRVGARMDFWTQMSFLDLYISSKQNGVHGKPTQFGSKALNGDFHEGPISFTQDYGAMYISRSNYKGNGVKSASDKKTVNLKIYKSNYESGLNDWGKAEEAVLFNSNDYSVAHPAFSADDNILYFASDMKGGYGGTDLYRSVKTGGQWGTPENLGGEINTPGDEKFPYIAKDGTLYFSSNGHYGLGGLDIYRVLVDKKTNKLGKVENLGAPFNSSKDDFGLIVAKDNQSGYFTSNRPGGLGSDDIYSWINQSVKLNVKVIDKITKEIIVGADCKLICSADFKGNKKTDVSGQTEYTVLPDSRCTLKVGKAGYKAKIFSVNFKKESKEIVVEMEKMNLEIKLEILVLNKATNQPIEGAQISVDSRNTSDKINAQTDQEGKLLVAGIKPNNEYYVTVEKETGNPNAKYLTVKRDVSTMNVKAPAFLKEVVYLDLVEKNVAIKIDNIYYDLAKWDIRPSAAKELDKLVAILEDNPTIEIELSSHTDCRSSMAYNMKLSSQRAESAVRYITKQGIDPKRMIATGYGESKLINGCKCEGSVVSKCSEAEHQENRRTEFKILKF